MDVPKIVDVARKHDVFIAPPRSATKDMARST